MPSRPGLVFAVSALLLTSALGTAACSSDVPPTTPPPVTTNDGGAVDPGAAAGDGGTGDPTTCAKTTSFVECEVCCGLDDTFAESQQVYADCICAGPCKDACGTTACGTAPKREPEPRSSAP